MQYLISVIVGLVLALYYNFTKRKSAEALLNNQDLMERIIAKNSEIGKNNLLLDAEEQKRKSIQEDLKQSKQGELNHDEVSKFYDDRNSPKQ